MANKILFIDYVNQTGRKTSDPRDEGFEQPEMKKLVSLSKLKGQDSKKTSLAEKVPLNTS